MSKTIRDVLPLPTGYASREAASFLAQMDFLSKCLVEDTSGLTPEALAWQIAPGMNTMGMLFAHTALVEVFWTSLVLADLQRNDIPFEKILGLGRDDDGMPLPEGGRPPAGLERRDLEFYLELLRRARENLRGIALRLTDAEMEREVTRTRPNGDLRVVSVRWTIFHMLEHFAGHYGQILLLQHEWKRRQAEQAKARG